MRLLFFSGVGFVIFSDVDRNETLLLFSSVGRNETLLLFSSVGRNETLLFFLVVASSVTYNFMAFCGLALSSDNEHACKK